MYITSTQYDQTLVGGGTTGTRGDTLNKDDDYYKSLIYKILDGTASTFDQISENLGTVVGYLDSYIDGLPAQEKEILISARNKLGKIAGVINIATLGYTITRHGLLSRETAVKAGSIVISYAAGFAAATFGVTGLVAVTVGFAVAIGGEYLVGQLYDSIVSNTGETKDPLILDLNHNNTIDLTALPNSSVLFDMNLDGKLESTGWVGPQDGMLVLDRNGNPNRACCFNALGTGGDETGEGGVRAMNAFDYATAA